MKAKIIGVALVICLMGGCSLLFGQSFIHMDENTVTFGAERTAQIFIDDTTPAPGDAWTLKTDNVIIKAIVLEAATVVIDTAIGPVPCAFVTYADNTCLRFKQNSRPWLEADFDARTIQFGGDIFAEQLALPVLFLDKFSTGYIAKIDGFNGVIELHGDIVLDPEDSSHWGGAVVLVKSKIALTQEDENEYIDSESDGHVDIGATTSIDFMIGGSPMLELRAMIAEFWSTIIDLPASARIRWNLGVQQIIEVGGKLRIGAQGSQGYVRMDGASGDVEMVGGSLCFVDPNGGMIEGEMSGYNGGITLTSVAQGDWDQIAAFTVNGPSNVVDPNHIEDHINITKDGRYACRWRWSGHGSAVAHDWEFLASKNNNAVMFTNTASEFTNPTTQKDVTVPGGGTILCEVGDTIELWVRRNTPGNNIILTTKMCWLYVRLTGGL